jgi:hypothetical protein
VRLILDNQAKRSFASADVNTVIALFSAPDDRREWALDQTARFVMFKVPFEHILSPVIFQEIEDARERHTTQEYRVFPLSQEALLEDGSELAGGENGGGVSGQQKGRRAKSGPLIKVARYIGNKWGGKYLRAPEIYWTVLEKGKNILCSIETTLGNVVTVSWSRQGHNKEIMTDIKDINDLYECIPVLKSPREFDGIIVNSEIAKTCLRTDLIDKKQIIRTPLVWDDIRRERHICRLNKDFLAFTHNFHGIKIHNGELTEYICACLNSTLVWLFIEILGRRVVGGFVRMLVNDLKLAPLVVNPELLTKKERYEIVQALSSLSKRPVYPIRQEIKSDGTGGIHIQSDRLSLDKIIFDVLELSQTEREIVYKSVLHFVEDRFEKESSLSPKERRKRLAAAEKTGGIWAGLPEEEDNGE